MADYIPLTAETEAPKPAAPRPDARDDIRGRAGVAPIKSEYVLPIPPRPVMDDDAAERGDSRDARDRDSRDDRDGDRGGKRQKTKTGWKGRTSGQKRPKPEGEAAVRICKAWESQGECPRGDECKYAHSWAGYFEVKPVDTHFEHAGALADSEPYLRDVRERAVGGEDTVGKTIDLATECPVFKDLGYCPYGWRCRFLGGHVRKTEGEGDGVFSLPGWELQGRAQVEGEAKAESSGTQEEKYGEVNWPNWDVLRALKANKYEWRFTPKYLKKVEPDKVFQLAIPKGQGDGGHGKKGKGKWGKGKNQRGPPAPVTEEGAMNGSEGAANGEEAAANGDATNGSAPTEEAAMNAETNGVVDGEAEAIDVPLRPEEKRRLNWDNGLYLAPLTTVGNLPFRRLCTDYGATITISEMALAQPLVTGQSEEWALVRRHKSERMFGVQLAGGFANRMVPTAEVLARELGPSGVDFVDVNMGCPIDMLFNQGAGSALMENPGRLGKILVGMNRALGEIPLTVKFRMGVYNGKPNAHKLIPRFATEWGAGAMTLHGRSRQQRYSKLADWDYVRECVDVLRDTVADAGMAPVPLFGNGDCFSAQSYWETKERTGVDGIMLARGALIKPWIFTEVAERREWDISATERLEGIRKFAEYGLSHWGSDTMGVNTTRRFLCEALSFQHRYIPIGLLERMPPMINERPPAYKGRSELETLLASPFVGDWIKISEMFLGPVDERFTFAPKHKSSAYGNEEAQG